MDSRVKGICELFEKGGFKPGNEGNFRSKEKKNLEKELEKAVNASIVLM